MKALLLLSLLSVPAFAADFECHYFQNLTEVANDTVSVNGKDQHIASVGDYEYFMSVLPEQKYELQALNNSLEVRTYATAKITPETPDIGLVIWSRQGISEVQCKLKAN
jgi:hypothetical protein